MYKEDKGEYMRKHVWLYKLQICMSQLCYKFQGIYVAFTTYDIHTYIKQLIIKIKVT